MHPNNGRDRNNKFDFACGIRENSMLDNCIQAIDKNFKCGTQRGHCPCQEIKQQGLNLTDICTSAYISECDLNDGKSIPAEPNVVVDEHSLMEHYKSVNGHTLQIKLKKTVFQNMTTCGPTTVSRDVHGKGPLN
ncbi:hypothetical protein Bpfe_010055 [Biomphalaria pfeifferi]|uniref:Uncharacterized protein n=1 Tax=Biomphalaria pfeifferi TaxID=112525 RepID=A0AAD8FD48_BIOPF|nr:hypothetical protein Bpfe_010055 [Biomphalaria pfeifferi]